MPVVYTEVEVDVSLDDFEDEDLIEELERRGQGFEVASKSGTELLNAIYEKRRTGKDYQRDLEDLIYLGIGKIL